jgi:3-dehydroquinate dehydratase
MNNEKTIKLQQELINLYEQQIMDLTMMSKIELGDDVIEEIKQLKKLIKSNI